MTMIRPPSLEASGSALFPNPHTARARAESVLVGPGQNLFPSEWAGAHVLADLLSFPPRDFYDLKAELVQDEVLGLGGIVGIGPSRTSRGALHGLAQAHPRLVYAWEEKERKDRCL